MPSCSNADVFLVLGNIRRAHQSASDWDFVLLGIIAMKVKDLVHGQFLNKQLILTQRNSSPPAEVEMIPRNMACRPEARI